MGFRLDSLCRRITKIRMCVHETSQFWASKANIRDDERRTEGLDFLNKETMQQLEEENERLRQEAMSGHLENLRVVETAVRLLRVGSVTELDHVKVALSSPRYSRVAYA